MSFSFSNDAFTYKKLRPVCCLTPDNPASLRDYNQIKVCRNCITHYGSTACVQPPEVNTCIMTKLCVPGDIYFPLWVHFDITVLRSYYTVKSFALPQTYPSYRLKWANEPCGLPFTPQLDFWGSEAHAVNMCMHTTVDPNICKLRARSNNQMKWHPIINICWRDSTFPFVPLQLRIKQFSAPYAEMLSLSANWQFRRIINYLPRCCNIGVTHGRIQKMLLRNQLRRRSR